jgi:hypothetical protein
VTDAIKDVLNSDTPRRNASQHSMTPLPSFLSFTLASLLTSQRIMSSSPRWAARCNSDSPLRRTDRSAPNAASTAATATFPSDTTS